MLDVRRLAGPLSGRGALSMMRTTRRRTRNEKFIFELTLARLHFALVGVLMSPSLSAGPWRIKRNKAVRIKKIR